MNSKKLKQLKTTSYIRIIAGLYLLYTDYLLLTDWENIKADNHQIIMTVVVVIFAIAALLLIAFSLKKLMRINKERDQYVKEEDNV